jgi:hypothetical protein
MVGNEGMMAFSMFRRERGQLSATDARAESPPVMDHRALQWNE